MLIQRDATIGEVVAKDFRAARIFENYGLDYCCGGKKTISDVCSSKGIDPDKLITELSILPENSDIRSNRFTEWEPDFLIDYIVNNHHNYVTSSLPVISNHSLKVASKHGERRPEVIRIAELFTAVKSDLEIHLQKEEKMLFPYIKKLALAVRNDLDLEYPPFGTVQNPIKVMESEHDVAGRLLDNIRELSNNYTPPPDACETYKVLYSELKEFENDLHVHVHLENNILFPKSLKLEENLTNHNNHN